MLLPFDFRHDPYLILDFSANNPDLATLDLTDTATFTGYVFGKMKAARATVGVGGYNEHRVIYRRSDHFNASEEPREIHLGIDFWAVAGTPVFAPLPSIVHSFQDNAHFGDYGPTIILEHNIEGDLIYSLYGHLTRTSSKKYILSHNLVTIFKGVVGLYEGKTFDVGDQIGEIGPYPENGDWPPHLHFQLMTDMLGLRGDFPGVCSLADRAKFLSICPNPNHLLGIPGL